MKQPLTKKWTEPFARLFSRAQINIIYACPPLCGIVPKDTYNTYQDRRLYIKRSLSVAAQVPRAVARHWRDRREKRVVLPRAAIIVTTRCTLKCDKCLSHVPDLGSQRDAPTHELLEDLRALLSCVGYIYDVCISGGEPFMHPGLDLIVRACADSGKIGNIKVITNGTIVPGETLLAALRDAKARVNVSKYATVPQPNLENILAVLKDNEICHYVISADNDFWVDTESFGPLKEGSPARRYSDCFCRLYYVLLSGKQYPCCQSAFLAYDGRIPEHEGDFINIRTVSPAAYRGELSKLNEKSAVSACAYCLGSNYKSPTVPTAIQREAPCQSI